MQQIQVEKVYAAVTGGQGVVDRCLCHRHWQLNRWSITRWLGVVICALAVVIGGQGRVLALAETEFQDLPVASEIQGVPYLPWSCLGLQGVRPVERLDQVYLGRGINLGHWLAQVSGGSFSPDHFRSFITEQDLAKIKAMGFDHVRLPIAPEPMFNKKIPALLGYDYLEYVDTAIGMALEQGLVVIVDLHPGEKFKQKLNHSQEHVEALGQFWEALANHLSGYDAQEVVLEVLNEPMVKSAKRWQKIVDKLIRGVRRGAPDHTIIVSGAQWSGIEDLLALNPQPDRNVIYSFHMYDPMLFTHQGADWTMAVCQHVKQVPYPSDRAAVQSMLHVVTNESARESLKEYGRDHWDQQRIDQRISLAAQWAKQHGVRVMCNEFGVYRRYANDADRVVWLEDIRASLEKHAMAWTMWNYNGGFGVVSSPYGQAQVDSNLLLALGLPWDDGAAKQSALVTSSPEEDPVNP